MIAVRAKTLEQRVVEWRARALEPKSSDSPSTFAIAPDLSEITDPIEYAVRLADIALENRLSIVIKNGRGDKPEFQLYLETKTGPPTISYRKQGNRYFTHEVRTLQAGFVIGASSPVDFANAVHSYINDLLKLRFPKEWIYPEPDRNPLSMREVSELKQQGHKFIDVDDISHPDAGAITIADAMNEGNYSRVLETFEAAGARGHLVAVEFPDGKTNFFQLLYVDPRDRDMKPTRRFDEHGVPYWSVPLSTWAEKKLANVGISVPDQQFWIGETPVPFEHIFHDLKVACRSDDMDSEAIYSAVRAGLINHFNFDISSKPLLGDVNDDVGFRVVGSIEVFKGKYGITTSEFLIPSYIHISLSPRVPSFDLVDKLRDTLTNEEPLRIRTENGNIIVSSGDYSSCLTIGEGSDLSSALHAAIANSERILEQTNEFAHQLERGLDMGLEPDDDDDDYDNPEFWNI